MKKEKEFNIEDGHFAEKVALFGGENNNNQENTQIVNDKKENLRAVDKKFVVGIIKEEKKQLREARKLEKANLKAENKAKKARLKQLIKVKKQQEKEERARRETILREVEKKGRVASWFRLDNAGSIYPSAIQSDWNFVFRITATMVDKVDSEALQKALDEILPRFPSFNVRLCHGFFWNYYERNFSYLKVERETTFPCRPFNLKDPEGFLIRVLYSDYNIILEVFHAITDGRGALVFLNSLIARYLEIKGVKINEFVGALNYLDIPDSKEVEDSFQVAYNGEKIKRKKEKKAYKIKGNLLPAGTLNTLEIELDVDKLKEKANEYGASVTSYLVALVGYVVYKNHKPSKKPVRVSVPIDLRPWYNSSTLRNFASYINVEIDGDNLEFKDAIEKSKKALSEINKLNLQANINANVRIQKNFFVKILPLFIKNPILKAGFKYLGENYQTLSLSNLGQVKAPKEFEKRVESYSFNLGRSMHNEKSIGVVAYNNKLNICISSKIYEAETEHDICTFLSGEGLSVKVYSNRRDLYGTR